MTFDSFIFIGHGKAESNGLYDPGAVSGGYIEYEIAKKLVNAAKVYLSKMTQLRIHYDESNYTDNDLVGNVYTKKAGISIHINAGKGKGTETYVPCREKELKADFSLVERTSKLLNIPNRGVKSRDYDTEKIIQRQLNVAYNYTDYYKEIREAWKQGISLAIFEVGFIDSDDIFKIVNNIDQIGFEIAKYVATICNAELQEPSLPNVDNNIGGKETYFRVIAGSFKERSRAEARKKDLEQKGYDGIFLEAKQN